MVLKTLHAGELGERIHERLKRLYFETDLDTIAEALASLEPVLERHFEHEEGEGGVFAQLRRRHPEAADRFSAFEIEHGEILAEVRALRAELDELTRRMDAAQARMTALVGVIRAHEATEAELMRSLRDT